jgi:hypothetical protein
MLPALPSMAGQPGRPAGYMDDEDVDFEDGAAPSGQGMPGGDAAASVLHRSRLVLASTYMAPMPESMHRTQHFTLSFQV